ncbi:rhomboid family intramembrane serine protease [Acaryochloris marina]|uniref:rhomboid family intramembrane serine protease n=1 Tax=Acaryochloris marina TaxID=155978 RepID=UPI001BB0C716|nr:rhomboid family intramembrane serine protease [Acaryochloris marina]QUY41890.1 rhomboid family intramembrane serine protease [Acaryochloris marina S15]
MRDQLKTQLQILGVCAITLWSIQLLNWITDGFLIQFGIQPRTLVGLRGILFAPFLHGNFRHLLANTAPFLVLGGLVMVRRIMDFFSVSLIVMVVGGLGTWLIGGQNTVHIGASGLVFGYLGYLLFRGYFERSWPAITLSVFVAIVYGSMLFGLLPTMPHISWEGHLFGFIGGGMAAKWLTVKPKSAG